MKISVDMEICLLHGQCVIAAPEIFSFDDDGGLVWVAEPDEALRADAEAAADACPEQAILID
ncbi:MAG: ferredoxin [Pseudodonghicola sp.]